MVSFGGRNDGFERTPPVLLSCREVVSDDEITNTIEIVIRSASGVVYRITFCDYLLHMIRNESFTVWDDYEIREGAYLVRFERSRLLDLADTVLVRTSDWSYPGISYHYGVYTEDHIIDVITCIEPEIVEEG